MFLLLMLVTCVTCQSPNIVFILMDDVGWSDVNFTTGESSIPTPHLDKLSAAGLYLSSYYTSSTCTPSRASLMTGRYAHNTGLVRPIFPGSVAGLLPEVPTMPELLRQAGYSAHMVGKWHLGFSQWAQTPVGRGFQSHVGGLLSHMDFYTKGMWRDPATFEGLDWGRYYENRSYHHFQELRHSTVAQTEEAVAVMKEHKEGEESENPLFLYVSYNAAHSPLQPEPEWEAECGHIPHLWRRQFCGMVVGLDRNINHLVDSARNILGENTVVVFSSDNGGSNWFGGLNAPLRAGKFSTFEGGVKVPAFMLDFSSRYSGTPGQELTNMFHISDWLPTFLSWAGQSHLTSSLSLDGLDQSVALVSPHPLVRKEMVLELVRPGESHHGPKAQSIAFRKGHYKVIQGDIPDPHWYYESKTDAVATSDTGLMAPLLEWIVRLSEKVWGNGPTDIIPHGLLLNMILFNHYRHQAGMRTLLFDLQNDPQEKIDISNSHPKVLKHMVEQLQHLKHSKKMPHHRYWYVDPDWLQTFVPGDCSAFDQTSEISKKCVFAHPWLPDSADLFDEEGLGLINDLERAERDFYKSVLKLMAIIIALIILIIMIIRKLFFTNTNTNTRKEKTN